MEVFVKNRFLLFAIVLVLVSVILIPVKAAAPVNFESSVQVRNLTDGAGKITLQFINPDGSQATPTQAEFPILANETLNFYQSTMPIASGFKGSMLISSTVQIAGMSNLAGKNGTGQRISFAAFSAFSSGSTTVYLPALHANNYGYNSFYSVQNVNVGTGSATVNVVYSDGVTGPTLTIPQNASVSVDQATEVHPVKVLAAKLTSNQPIVVTVTIVGDTLFSYNGFQAGSVNPVIPLVNENNYGFFTGVQIMNTGSTVPTTVTVSYSPTLGGTACTETRTIAAGTSKTFAQYAFYNNEPVADPSFITNCTKGTYFVGSGLVTANSANQPLVAVVNQLQLQDNKGGAYGAFDPAAGGSKVIYPLIMDRNYGYFTSWSIVNVNPTTLNAGQISCLVTGKDKVGNPVAVTFTNPTALAQYGGWTMNHLNALADGFVGGATCTSPAGSKLVGTSNQLGIGDDWVGIDSLLVSEAFIQP
jgi:hypothetical protein